MNRPVQRAKRSGNPIDKHVGARVRMRRMALKMSQGTLGQKLGITFQQIQKYEKGTNRIGASRLQHIADLLGVPIAFFFDGAPGGSAAADDKDALVLTDFLATADGLALVKAFVRITDRSVRAKIVHLVRSIASDSDTD
jgi:transcriptional regulator with XRE-family HTH domain